MRFPDSPSPQFPYKWVTSNPSARSGNPWALKVRNLTHIPLHQVTLTYNALSFAQVQTLRSFFDAVGGSRDTFAFADFNGYSVNAPTIPTTLWTDLPIGLGDAATTVWTLPTYLLQQSWTIEDVVYTPTVKVAGVTKNISWHPDDSGPDGYIVSGGDADGLDTIHFASAPANGAFLTITGVCRRAMRKARFSADEFPFSTTMPWNLQGGSVDIVEQII